MRTFVIDAAVTVAFVVLFVALGLIFVEAYEAWLAR